MEPPAITPRRRRPFLAPVWLTMLVAVIAIGIAVIVFRSATNTVVVLVGPAEKDIGTIDDPPLSDDGELRAQRLARMFGEGAGPERLSAVYTSGTRAAQQTAAPLAERLGIHPIVVSNAKDTAARVMHDHEGDTVLLIGTSASVPQLVREFSGRDLATSKDDEYDTVYVISIPTFGDSRILRLKY
jgi:2,3-bisphosphoglycerate-dependent phosphoglycerate mutase